MKNDLVAQLPPLGGARKLTTKNQSLKTAFTLIAIGSLFLFAAGCQVLTYTSPTGEHFSRSSIGANVALSSLKVEADTNGVRHVELQGYASDSSQTATAVTEAAVKAAIQSAK
jgi:hypothetical protein